MIEEQKFEFCNEKRLAEQSFFHEAKQDASDFEVRMPQVAETQAQQKDVPDNVKVSF